MSLDPDRLRAVGLTAVDVSQRLCGTNVDVAGGRAEIGKNDQAIRTLAGAKTVNELAGTMISLPAGSELRLDDIGAVIIIAVAYTADLDRPAHRAARLLGVIGSAGIDLVLVGDPDSPFFTTPHLRGHSSVLLRGSRIGELTAAELEEVVYDAWLARAGVRARKAWLTARDLDG